MNRVAIVNKLRELERRLYDADTSREERSELSMQVSILRGKLGCKGIDHMMKASEEEEVGS